MREHLEFVAGRSAKFWEVGVDGKTMTVRFGRLGSTGQTKATKFATPAAALAAATALVAAKRKKGYAAPAKKAPAKKAPAKKASAKKAPAKKAPAKKPAAPTDSNPIEKLVQQLDRLTREYLRGEGGEGDDPDDPDEYQLLGPPPRAQLAAHLKLYPDLPPSYREFLQRHAGWRGFWGGTSLLGPRTPKNASEWKTILRDVSQIDGYLYDDDDPADPMVVRAADIIPIAYNDNGGVLAFDRRKPARNGELAVVDCMRSNGCVDNRHKNFAEFLRSRIACTKGWIADQ